ncbi:MAG: hypothetical protein E7447_04030 [Ruminococcaceae bacterium]|nr:hypothetical protein [Oscillospiraceae bacterium]
MRFLDSISNQWKKFLRKWQDMKLQNNDESQPLTAKILRFWYKLEKFKKLILAVPVAALTLVLAMVNLIKLPALVGFGLQADGTYSFQIIREVAVLAPMVVTAVCLLLMFASKRTLTPWMVSVFSLLLPLIILLTNTFPG